MELLSELLRSKKLDSCECGWGKVRREQLREILKREYSPMDTLERPLSEIIRKVKRLTNEEAGYVYQHYSVKSRPNREFFHEVDENETLHGRLKEMKRDAGISIACARNLGSSGI
jgi:hypothetical protein